MLVSDIQRFIDVQGLLHREARVIVSVSGGADSMALLAALHDLMSTYRLTLFVAHINHHLRDEEASRDALFVEGQAGRLGLPFHTVDVDVRFLKRRTGMSSQQAARQLRYGALLCLRDSLAATHVALGHTASDQAETVLLRLLRGAGAAGLAGIPAKRLPFIRPLLGVHRDSIRSYLGSTGIPWVEDSSNKNRAYQRNRVRLELLPVLGAYGPGVARRLCQTADVLRADNDVLEQQTIILARQTLGQEVGGAMFSIRRPPFLAAPLAMQRRLFRYALDRLPGSDHAGGFQDIDTLVRFTASDSGAGRRLTLTGEVTAEWHHSVVLLWNVGTLPTTTRSLTLPVPGLLTLQGLSLSLGAKTLALDQDWRNLAGPRRAFVCAETALPPLTIRFPRPGDRFQPLGAPGSQKLQDYFVNSKVPRALRPYVPLVLSRGQIVWVVGYRIADPFKVRAGTRPQLELSCFEAACGTAS